MRVLNNIEPRDVFKYFEDICSIPHGSANTKQISDYCVSFAEKNNLEYIQDEFNNIIIKKPATAGYENSEPVIIQGHLDMVCEKSPDCRKDMTKEGIDLVVSGDVISADGTTLGGDDGIAVAMALAILADKTICHPKLEVIFTIDEEIGMIGASKLDVSSVSGRKMINIDSENEGVFTVSCAGGNVSSCILPINRQEQHMPCYKLEISGLTGGHSGVEIDKGRANSNILIGRILYRLNSISPLCVSSVDGGLKDNAIANKSTACFVSDGIPAKEFENLCMQIKNEYQTTDSGLKITLTEESSNLIPMDRESTNKVLYMLLCLPNGIQAMSMDIDGLVQTSLNLGILKTSDESVCASFCVRSSIESQKEMLVDHLKCAMQQIGGKVSISGDYPGWEYNKNSTLQKIMCDVFTEQYGYEPEVEAIHAGVECGLFAGKLPGLDCISIGPNLTDIHTYREKMSISSVKRVWEFVLEVLKRLV